MVCLVLLLKRDSAVQARWYHMLRLRKDLRPHIDTLRDTYVTFVQVIVSLAWVDPLDRGHDRSPAGIARCNHKRFDAFIPSGLRLIFFQQEQHFGSTTHCRRRRGLQARARIRQGHSLCRIPEILRLQPIEITGEWAP